MRYKTNDKVALENGENGVITDRNLIFMMYRVLTESEDSYDVSEEGINHKETAESNKKSDIIKELERC